MKSPEGLIDYINMFPFGVTSVTDGVSDTAFHSLVLRGPYY